MDYSVYGCSTVFAGTPCNHGLQSILIMIIYICPPCRSIDKPSCLSLLILTLQLDMPCDVQVTCLCPYSPALRTCHCHKWYVSLYVSVPAGYGFVDFDSPASAQKAVTALKAGGVQAQMAKVRVM